MVAEINTKRVRKTKERMNGGRRQKKNTFADVVNIGTL